MAAIQRPYFIVFKGVEYMIEATSPALAIADVVGPDVTELRPARAAEVLAWAKANKPTRVAGSPRGESKTIIVADETDNYQQSAAAGELSRATSSLPGDAAQTAYPEPSEGQAISAADAAAAAEASSGDVLELDPSAAISDPNGEEPIGSNQVDTLD